MANDSPKAPANPAVTPVVPNPALPTEVYRPNIILQGSPDFQKTVSKQLDQFLATNTGQRWANAYRQTGQAVTIQPTTVGSTAMPVSSGTLIYFNPEREVWYIAGDNSIQQLHPYQSMGHELIHALHHAEGSSAYSVQVSGGMENQEEADTIGLGDRAIDSITETALLNEIDQPPRVDHLGFTSKEHAALGRGDILAGRPETASSISLTNMIIGAVAITVVAVVLVMWLMRRDREPDGTEVTIGQLNTQSDRDRDILTAEASVDPNSLHIVSEVTAPSTPDTAYQPLFNTAPSGFAQANSQGAQAIALQGVVLNLPASSITANAERTQYAASLSKQTQP